jgi:phosphate transport system substrate-binding protein
MALWRILSSRLSAVGFGVLLAGALLVGVCPLGASSSAAVELHGAGATFPAPLYQAWIERFQKLHPDVAISYEPVGSGEGLARLASGGVDFAGSDVPVPATGAGRFEHIGAQLPATAGMIVLAYNLPGVTGGLELPRSVYTDIFLGKIRRWDDPRIAAANPGLEMPAMNIAVIGRLDSSGTTFAFTSHLAAANPSWTEDGPGVGKIVSWPRVAMLARGNEGVASRVKISVGAIGYMEYGFARGLGLPMASLENREGKIVAPSPEAGAAAISATGRDGLDSLASSVIDPSGAQAYPIVTYSWLMLLRDYPAEQSRALRSFLDFALGEGQNLSADLGYIPLPPAVADLSKAVVARMLQSEARGPASSAAQAGGDKSTAGSEAAAPPPAAPAPSTPPATRGDTYTVAAGDTFKSIALKLYGDARRWRDIAAANPKLDPRKRLRAGDMLKLPQPVEAAGRPL